MIITDKIGVNQQIKADHSNKFANKKYMMHKYWGKKPANELKELIDQFTQEGDLLFDPFAGYGGFSSEAILANRNVISNDLNPISNFINQCLLSTDVDLDKLKEYYSLIKKRTADFRKFWYDFNDQGQSTEIITALRNHQGKVIRLKLTISNQKKLVEIPVDDNFSKKFQQKEDSYQITDWYPHNPLIINSRISAKPGMTVASLFDVRSLASHAKLLEEIKNLPESSEKSLLLLAFTANLANCSKLVPPIKSCGAMSQGAWMTGFYVGETYLENNVFHYFENRVAKIIAGKKEFLEQYNDLLPKGGCKITNQDAKKLMLSSDRIDFVFTDFPYGDVVPYFEQSIIWNSWLQKEVDYKNEIVISDSNTRDKSASSFRSDITQAIKEIYRVLKPKNFFVFTYHSLSGFEWTSITNALLEVGFSIVDCKLLVQKTFTPRQLNRAKTIKGDLLIICQKKFVGKIRKLSDFEEVEFIKRLFKEVLLAGSYETNDIIVQFLKKFFASKILIKDQNMFARLEEVADFDGNGWIIDDELYTTRHVI